MRKFTYLAAIAIAASGFGLAGCDDNDLSQNDRDLGTETRSAADSARDNARTAGNEMQDAARTAGDKLESAANETGQAIRNGADAVGDAAHDATHSDAGDVDVDRTPDSNDAAGAAADTTPGDTVAPNGTAMAPDAEGIRDILASSTEAALTKGGFDDLVERFVDADRNRIGDFAEQDMPELDGIVAAIQKDWQAKYNQEFDISNEQLVFNDSYQIQQGEIPEQARTAGDVTDNAADNAAGNDAGDRNLDPGRNVATVTVPSSHDLPQLKLNLIHEMPDNWRIDVPDNVDGARLQQNLKDHLTAVKNSAGQWPADVNEAYRLVSHHVFMAINDQPVNANGNNGM